MDMSMPMASSTSSPDLDMYMSSTFFTSTTTPLYSPSWHPSTTAAYAGTCIFLVLLAVVFRSLLALRAGLNLKWERLERERVVVVAVPGGARDGGRVDGVGGVDLSRKGSESSAGSRDGMVDRRMMVGGRDQMEGNLRGGVVRPWRISQDGVRSLVDVAVAGVGYLLMLAVMTYNVGYFLSVLAGVWVGSLAFGRWDGGSLH